jgi:hypothetical protein
MAEIKSTLELIMERTKNLTMTEEEKENLQKKESAGKINGLIQKYLDRIISANTLKSEIELEEKTFPEFRQMAETALLDHLQPDQDNRNIFQALEQALGINTEPLQRKVTQFQKEVEAEKEKFVKTCGDALKERSIFGSAVIPNPAQDETLQSKLQKMKEDFKKQGLKPQR